MRLAPAKTSRTRRPTIPPRPALALLCPPPPANSSSQGPSTDASDSKQKHSLLGVPQSGPQQSTDSHTPTTGLSGATTAADAESVGRGSKRSLMGKRRAASTASSKRSQPRAAASEKTEQPPPVPAAPNRPASTRSKTRKGGLLSCLPCFAPKESRLTGDSTPPENVKQAQKVPAGRTSQSTPVKKQEPVVAESSKIDSKEPLDEKTGADALAPTSADKPNNGDGTAEQPAAENGPQVVTRSPSQRQQQAEAPSPPQPATLQTGHPQINVTNPTPVATPVLPRPSAEQQRIIEDQTEEQKQIDNDIEMKDVPLSSNDVPHEGETAAGADAEQAKVDLPPPPPLAERQVAVQDQSADVGEAPEEQKFLLGPIAPRFQGKKCLVLDLDETLVHSSFKVCPHDQDPCFYLLTSSDSAPSRLHYPCGD